MRLSWKHTVLTLHIAGSLVEASSKRLPVVDLGYTVHQAISYNSTGQYYSFSNIRYAQPPTGDLRFAAPLPPLTNRTLQKGEIQRSCPQAYPLWYLKNVQQLDGAPPPDPDEDEDCLFLDVVVPEKTFEKAKGNGRGGAPVMVWLYGGGFAFGQKNVKTSTQYVTGNPAGLLALAKEEDEEGVGIIYVTLNYRGGAFGFLSGPNLQTNGTANAGLLDQRLALEWVQRNIHLFGGDRDRVTVFGQSAGAGSIMHQITAYGGLRGKVPFQKAILQSPGYQPYPGNWQQDQVLQSYLAALNVTTIDQARKLPYESLRRANQDIVGRSPYGQFTFSPAVDGSFVPALPSNLLLHGAFDKSIRIMTGYNANETFLFVDKSNLTNDAFVTNIKHSLPGAQPAVVDFITNTLYPDFTTAHNSSLPYDDELGRSLLSSSESSFTCNTLYLNRAFRDQAFGYRWSVPPAYHGLDVPYTFYNGPNPAVRNGTESLAISLQTYLTTFAMTGSPNRAGAVPMPLFGSSENILDVNVAGLKPIKDPQANSRCEWLQKALFF